MSNTTLQTSSTIVSPREARQRLESASVLNWFHWMVILGSLLLTFFAWHYSSSEKQARIEVQFDREVERVMELVLERMGKYEDALWGGVALINTSGGDVPFESWQSYAQSIHIQQKYPGINGIGVIHSVDENGLEDYLSQQRITRPNFNVHPEHENDHKLPISYILPIEGNEKAVGLDIAHESNRFTAAIKARNTGKAQITGPITLVQDQSRTPGFLFYAPFYKGGAYQSHADRQKHFSGMVYAPFVVKKLMKGTLERNKRQVGIGISDMDQVLYDEHLRSEEDYDPHPIFKRTVDAELFGRVWKFDIWSSQSFRVSNSDNQPLTILIGGILIDCLLILLFVSISRSSNRALKLADSMTTQLEANSKVLQSYAQELKQSNNDLEQFAFIASHDLQEPLRKVSSFCSLLKNEHNDQLNDEGKLYLDFAVDGATRMKNLIQDLLTFSKIGSGQVKKVSIDANRAFDAAVFDLSILIKDTKAKVSKGDLPSVYAKQRELNQLLQNLISNSIRYRSSKPPVIFVDAASQGDNWLFSVSDNGIGIQPEYHDQVFGIFKRLHSKKDYPGTGIGLAICKRIVDGINGKIWIESDANRGCTVFFYDSKADH